MAASDQTYRDQRHLDIWFAISSLLMLGSTIWMFAEDYFAAFKPEQRVFRDGFWVDLVGYGIVQSYALALAIAWIVRGIDSVSGVSRFRIVSDWPIALQVAFFIVTHDLVTYLIHRGQHRSNRLWRTHEAHHSVNQVDWLSGIRSHSVEILMYQTAEFLPFVLLGGAPEVALWKAMANSIYGMYIHSNLSWKMGPLLWVLNGPELHRWHHANDDARAFGMNLATKFTIWDRLFGTLWLPDRRATDYGTHDPFYPHGYVGQHAYAFRVFSVAGAGG